MKVYLDNAATTKVHSQVAEQMTELYCQEYGNPSSLHEMGVDAERHIKEASEWIASTLKCKAKEIIYTSGGTESNNLAILGAASSRKRKGMHLITTQIEHPAVLRPMQHLEEMGYQVTYLPVDQYGRVGEKQLLEAITPETILVSIMHTNNEVGTMQDLLPLGKMIKQKNPDTLFHVDAVQGYGKNTLYPKRMLIDLLSVSAHKIHGPKGVGFLYCDEKVRIHPILFGGGQQAGMRSGTENVPGILGMAMAAKKSYDTLEKDVLQMRNLQNRLAEGILQMDGTALHGLELESPWRAPHILSTALMGIKSEVLLHALEDKGIYVSTRSACASRHVGTVTTLQAMGVGKEEMDATIRWSLSSFTTQEEIDYTLETLRDMIPMLRKYTKR